MSLGQQLISWRHLREWSQETLASKAGITRAYLSRLEADQADPSLSILRRLASTLEISIGTLLETAAPHPEPNREELDQLARAIFHPGAAKNKNIPQIRSFARAFKTRRSALGLGRSKSKPAESSKKLSRQGLFTLRRLRATLGEKNWKALLQRIDKHAAFQANRTQP